MSRSYKPGDPWWVAIVFPVAFVLSLIYFHRAGKNSLRTWADRERLIIESASVPWTGGPFWITTRCAIFYVVVRDDAGLRKSGYVRCRPGGRVEVVWD